MGEMLATGGEGAAGNGTRAGPIGVTRRWGPHPHRFDGRRRMVGLRSRREASTRRLPRGAVLPLVCRGGNRPCLPGVQARGFLAEVLVKLLDGVKSTRSVRWRNTSMWYSAPTCERAYGAGAFGTRRRSDNDVL